MSTHAASVQWTRQDEAFTAGRYSRCHEWSFDGGAIVAASPSPQVVPAPWSDAAAVDPEEALVAAAASCHMLWFLSLAAERGFVVDRYEDEARGTLGRTARGRIGFTAIALHPRITFGGERTPSAEEIDALHAAAHERCFIANSLNCPVHIEAA